MKVKSLFFVLFLGISTSYGQIILENTYTTDGGDEVSFSFAAENGLYFYTLSATENNVKIYNSSHVLI